MHTMDAIDRSFSAGYEHGAKDYKEQRELVLQENAELVEKIEQLQKERDEWRSMYFEKRNKTAAKHLGENDTQVLL